ncbi:MAG: nucleotidyltransferase, partial [Ginsengibacter sp.]
GVSAQTWCIIGYQLSKTLSENGTVSRGVCQVDNNGNLISIAERIKIYPEGNKIVYEENNTKTELPADTSVSMNFWCFHQNAFDYIQQLFQKFLQENGEKPKSEFFIPIVGDGFIKEEKGKIKVIQTSAQWFGVTYKEDAPGVKQSIEALVKNGVYPNRLWK